MLAALIILWVITVPHVAAAVQVDGASGSWKEVTPRPAQRTMAHTVAVPPETRERIGWCESHNIATSTNPASTAKGRYQFLDSSWKHYGNELWGTTTGKDVFNYADNTELANYVMDVYGTNDWLESKPCWDIIPN